MVDSMFTGRALPGTGRPPRQRRPARLGRTPIEGAAAEIEPIYRDAISYRKVVGRGEGRIIVIENRKERSNKL